MFDLSDPFLRPGPCAHPAVTDEALAQREGRIERTWGAASPLKCPDCNEHLYPHDDGDAVTVFAGEPYGAGRE